MLRSLFFLSVISVFCCISLEASGDSPGAYLSQIDKFTASFMQVSGDGAVVHGRVYVLKPFVKWVYDYGEDTLELVFDGHMVSYYDKSLNEVNNFVVLGGFQSIFSGGKNLHQGMESLKATKIRDDRVRIDGEEKGSGVRFSLYLETNPVVPFKMDIFNPGESPESISFFDVNTTNNISRDIFILKKENLSNGDF